MATPEDRMPQRHIEFLLASEQTEGHVGHFAVYGYVTGEQKVSQDEAPELPEELAEVLRDVLDGYGDRPHPSPLRMLYYHREDTGDDA